MVTDLIVNWTINVERFKISNYIVTLIPSNDNNTLTNNVTADENDTEISSRFQNLDKGRGYTATVQSVSADGNAPKTTNKAINNSISQKTGNYLHQLGCHFPIAIHKANYQENGLNVKRWDNLLTCVRLLFCESSLKPFEAHHTFFLLITEVNAVLILISAFLYQF